MVIKMSKKYSKEKTVLITGCTSGIGYELAEIFAKNKYRLILVSRNKSKLIVQKRKYVAQGLQVISIATDLSKVDAAKKLFDALKTEKIHILVNNAGVGDYGLFSGGDWKKIHSMMNLNMITLTRLTHLILPQMITRGEGKILNVSSVAGFQPGPMMAVYFATKAYVTSFSQAIAKEVEDYGITITSLCPGGTQSNFMKSSGMDESQMMQGKKLPSSRLVAEFGYDALMKGKLVAIHGFGNKFMACLIKFVPRKVLLSIMYKLMKPK